MQHVDRAGLMTRLFGWRYVVVLVPPGWFDRFADHPDVVANPRMYHDAVQSGSYGYSDGEWRFTHTAADAWRWAAPPAFPHVGDVVVEADARISSATAGAVALVLGLNASGTDFHLFEAFSDGRYAVFRRQAGAWQTLLSPAPSAALATGGASNHLMAARQSGLTYLYANGELLGMVTDLDVPAGRVGIYASNVLPGFEARFDNVRAYGLR